MPTDYVLMRFGQGEFSESRGYLTSDQWKLTEEKFNVWLNSVKAEAWDEGQRAYDADFARIWESEIDRPGDFTPNPYRSEQ
ncbi:MAG TPA: hypothetical protein VK149_04140 [Sideroxyarcus sp.]|nr:hypothetical protein [Sideroxyarcus sp.]